MKIILTAFGEKLISQPIDVPEETLPIFTIALTQPIQCFDDGYFKENLMTTPIKTICEFKWTGKYIGDSRLYVMARIDKR